MWFWLWFINDFWCVFFQFAEFIISKHFNHSVCVELHAPLNLQRVFFFQKTTRFCEAKYEVSPLFAEPLEWIAVRWDGNGEMEIHWPHLEAFDQKKSISWDFKKGWLAFFFAVWGMLWNVCLYFGSSWHFSDLLMTYPLMSYPDLSNDTSSWKCSRFWNAVSNIPFFCIPALYCLYRGHGIYDHRVQMIWISNSSIVTEKWEHHTSKINYGL